jgi:hypothetical protein
MSFAEYAQARMQARFGRRPGAAVWGELEAARGLPAYLAALRRTHLASWVTGIDPASNLHGIEARLRARFRAHVAELARWLPPEWRPAVTWVGELVDLPALDRIVSGEGPLPWMLTEPGLRALAGGGAAPGFLRRGAPQPGGARAAWLAEWQRRWPAAGAASRRRMRRLVAAVCAHLARFRHSDTDEGWRMRAALERELRLLFRRFALRPEAAFPYLGLAALDLERLRAGLVRRYLLREADTAP